ncbi:Peptidyl-tRNA hydrolase [Micavibrio aeruginosavorus EPB]|uniref:Peptidyl-tRNA hydrolase n=2 Tax=Micavibrio aeruginosavorus TaxID=349221 RepID=M4VER3_9BACT|nr:Peptidyl-tRNA hydrolase [Micavibrio aeruginosavorus EPB]
MWLLVGLGNPGQKYADNRHNIGFMAIDAIARAHGFPEFRTKFQGLMAEGRIGGEKVALLKPQTYMNESGMAVGAAAKFFKVTPNRIVVFHDELDLAASKLRIKVGGGHAGHNGLRSIDSHLGRADYMRVRLGIGHPGDKDRVHGHVLGDFSKDEQKWVDAMMSSIPDHVGLILSGKENDFMSKVASDLQPPKEQSV